MSLPAFVREKSVSDDNGVGNKHTPHTCHDAYGFMVQSFPDLGRNCISRAKYCRITLTFLGFFDDFADRASQ